MILTRHGYWFEGGYDKEEKAAKAYDLAALKYWGPTTHINFPVGFSFRDSITIESFAQLLLSPKDLSV
jgi:hypothetical protein